MRRINDCLKAALGVPGDGKHQGLSTEHRTPATDNSLQVPASRASGEIGDLAVCCMGNEKMNSGGADSHPPPLDRSE